MAAFLDRDILIFGPGLFPKRPGLSFYVHRSFRKILSRRTLATAQFSKLFDRRLVLGFQKLSLETHSILNVFGMAAFSFDPSKP